MGGSGSGRPGKPNHLKILEGSREDRINRSEPTPAPADSVLEPPCEMSDDARAVWNRLAPDLTAKKVLSPWDLDQFAVFCDATARYHECKALMGGQYLETGAAGGVIKSPYWQIMRDCAGLMTQIGSRFGLTPSDRARLTIDADEGPSAGAERLLS